MHNYSLLRPLQSNHDSSQLIECDNLVIKMLRRKKGLSATDAAHRFWLDESSGGFGFKSFLEEDLIAVAREIEVVLNGKDIDSKALRGRLKAFRVNPKSNYCNHVKQCNANIFYFKCKLQYHTSRGYVTH